MGPIAQNLSIEHPTSNIEHPTVVRLRRPIYSEISCWYEGVIPAKAGIQVLTGCWIESSMTVAYSFGQINIGLLFKAS